ncbi:MAG: hypothetical protein GX595_20180, partial [Lentisphaerae bacterium]|nr:hypothetical protein [Lentisphaerota bacterium]
DRTVDGHCDCAFWINLHRWCTPDVGALIAPRPLLVASGTEDVLWRPQAFREVMARLRRQYQALGAAESCALVEDHTPHGYTPVLRRAIFAWFNRHLKGDDRPVVDDVTPFVEPEENLLVFGGHPPAADRMREVERLLIRRPSPALPTTAEGLRIWQAETLSRLRQTTFPATAPAAPPRLCESRAAGSAGDRSGRTWVFATADAVELRAHLMQPAKAGPAAAPLVAACLDPAVQRVFCCGLPVAADIQSLVVEVRDTGATALGAGLRNTARRLYMNHGQTLPERQVHDLLAALALVRPCLGAVGTVAVYGKGAMAPQAIYAALLDPGIDEIILEDPPATHDDPSVAEFLAVLQVGDLPQNLALAWPRRITFVGAVPAAYEAVGDAYAGSGHGDRVRRIGALAEWRPVTP